MIQDIQPHSFKNQFFRKRPSQDSYILFFRNQKILLKHIENLEIPTLKDFHFLSQQPVSCDYLFSIDSREYYLMNQPEEFSGNEILAFYPASIIREMQPMWTAFAAANGHELYRFYHSNRFCGCCGAPMGKSLTERATVCPDCGFTAYPKLSPAVIVAITDKDKLLLTKYAGREYTRYALVAGYTEFGETLEQTVHREVMEEVGLKVKNIRYYKSQPWAFSDSLLVGFFAEVDGSTEIHLDQKELSTAVWLNRQEIPCDFNKTSLTHEMILRFKSGYNGPNWNSESEIVYEP
ncbi:MAG TPA: NAD(+) diphosphatase [Candidatus Hungatella pullicola]|nr:NAD(+) diphosphatase [Candidatus Hungatella pullicola]